MILVRLVHQACLSVIPLPFSVIPAKAGIQARVFQVDGYPPKPVEMVKVKILALCL